MSWRTWCLWVLLVVVLLPGRGRAQDKPSLGVLEAALVGKDFDPELRPVFTSLVRGRVVDLVKDSVRVIEGSQLEKLVKTNMAACSNADCLVKFVRQVGLDYLLETRLLYRKGGWTVTLKLASARTSSLLGEKTATFENEAEVQKGLPLLAEQVVKSLAKGTTPSVEVSVAVDNAPVAPPEAGMTKVIVKFGSIPSGMAVSVDGKVLGQTPKEKAVLQGDHWVEMSKVGYSPRREKVALNRNGQELLWSLSPIRTRLSLDAVDDQTGNDLIADVYVDGVKIGQTPFNGLVAVNAARIEVVREGSGRKVIAVALEEGKVTQATAHFRNSEKPKVTGGMVPIPAGCFVMGSRDGEGDEKPMHQVCLDAFSMDKYEVVQSAFLGVMGNNPSMYGFMGDSSPVENVDWNQANEFCGKVGKRLPTEAEWEYAARAGTTTKWSWGDYEDDAQAYAWYSSNSRGSTHPVGQKRPNAWGLYDMAGNVGEWVADWKGSYASDPQQSPKGPSAGTSRVLRGGGWRGDVGGLRSARRDYGSSDARNSSLGFRCVSP